MTERTEALTRGGVLPLHEQLAEELCRQAEARPPGERLPTEMELINSYGVSRTTIRRAMQVLIDRDVVVRRPGLGTFVKAPSLTHRLTGTAPFLADLFAAGEAHEIKLVGFSWGDDPTPAGHPLEGSGWLTVKRLYLREGRPLAFAHFAIPEPAGSKVSRSDMEESIPLAVLQRIGVQPSNVRFVLGYEPASSDLSELLDLAPFEPCMRVTRRIDDQAGRPCLWSWTYLPANQVEFSIDIPTGSNGTRVRAEGLDG